MHAMRGLVLAGAAVVGVLLISSRAAAHDLKATVDVSADPARVVAGYDDETPAEQAVVKVFDAAGNEIATGKTDDHGVWTFPRPQPGNYTLKVKDYGHGDTVNFVVPEDPNTVAIFAGWRMNKTLGLGIGVVGLLGLSAGYWLVRRRRM